MSDNKGNRDIYSEIWGQFALDREKNRAKAYVNLQRALSVHAADLVPVYMTAREHMSIVTDIEEWTKSDQQSESGDPVEAMAEWLRGDKELSRIPLEGIRKQ